MSWLGRNLTSDVSLASVWNEAGNYASSCIDFQYLIHYMKKWRSWLWRNLNSDVSLASVFNEGGNDASSRIDFQDFEDMVMSVLATKVSQLEEILYATHTATHTLQHARCNIHFTEIACATHNVCTQYIWTHTHNVFVNIWWFSRLWRLGHECSRHQGQITLEISIHIHIYIRSSTIIYIYTYTYSYLRRSNVCAMCKDAWCVCVNQYINKRCMNMRNVRAWIHT